ncbi:MAG TPA: permease prefix domain 1-containing protein, partial [Gammaproteobacteria bacterium]|nr:permease prefix domain 1-containing protein [Gammaproteobacteria bacterium]
MERLRGFPRRFRFPWRSAAQIDRDVEDELAFHLAEKTEALQRDGLSCDEARAEALRQFGDLRAAHEQLAADDRRGETLLLRRSMLEDAGRDIRQAWRSLRRSPGFTGAAIAT